MKHLHRMIALGLLVAMSAVFAACGEGGEPEIAYGELSIEDVKVYINEDKNYTFAEINPVFTKPEKAETLTFTYDATKLNIENNVVTPKARTNETYPVTAKSEHFRANFNVEVEYLRWSGAEAKYGERYDVSSYPVDYRAQTCQAVNAKTTLFLGDSFMDDNFIGEYMTEFKEGKEVLNAGMSSTTSYHWERAYETIIGGAAPKNIVFHIGTNNFYDLHDDVEETEASLCRLMMYLHTSYPTANIYWFNITQRKDTGYAGRVTETNTYMAEWCAKYDWITCVDTCSK
ncbi:MAG: SGNH/GDSL hydrolase family protein, partial [Clostridia bacterium]|nr:SGNH/GDSL hydrolase family protein [Clostridia bacterium]